MDYTEFCIDKYVQIRYAMRQLDNTGRRILFVTDGSRLVASLTDGDVRRHLLSGGNLDDKVAAAANYKLRTAANRDDAIAALKKNKLCAVPIIRNESELVAIVFQNDVEEPNVYSRLCIPVVIMAGGKGARLDPYTRVLPKPLIPVGELPIIEYIMQEFVKYECNDFHIIVNHKKQLIKAYFAESEHRYNMHWYDEDKPLGTGGGLYMLKGKVSKPFFLTNCDILVQTDYNDILNFHQTNKNAVTMVCAYKNLTIPYGVIETGKNGEIIAMKEKPELSFQTNTGMYLVNPEVLEDIEDEVPIGFPDIIEKQKQNGRRVAVYPVSEKDWLDMGQLTELEKMRERLYGE